MHTALLIAGIAGDFVCLGLLVALIVIKKRKGK